MNFKEKTFRDKNIDPFNLVCPHLEPAFTRSFCQKATSCLDQQLDHDSDRFLEMPGRSLDVS
jgi:hypothetical protein